MADTASDNTPPEHTTSDGAASGGTRLQKAMAQAGIASRRASEILIAEGRVSVNGEIVTTPGRRVDITRDKIAVDGKTIAIDPERITVMLNKPAGVVSTLHDEHGRPDLRQYVARFDARLFNVGRLDEPTRGLLLLTNDGELAQRLAHPTFEVRKVYLATVQGVPKPRDLRQLQEGVELEDGVATADRARLIDANGSAGLVEITLHSGKNRIVRRMLAAVGHPVTDLLRVQYAGLRLDGLKPGKVRQLTTVEVGSLWDASATQTVHERHQQHNTQTRGAQ